MPADAGSHLGHNFWNENDREISIRHLADSDVPTVSGSRYMAKLRAIGAYWGLSETIGDWIQE